MTRGVRQGDPMSPFLFIIAMEGLNIAMMKAKRGGFFEGINLPHNGPSISHFLFADDALFVGKWSKENMANLLGILRCFHLASSLKVNLSKTMLYATVVGPASFAEAAASIHCNAGVLPFKYLGLPVGASMSRCAAWLAPYCQIST